MSEEITVLSKRISETLTGYSADVTKRVRKAVSANSEKLTNALKKNSPRRAKGSGKRSRRYAPGAYARSWADNVEDDNFSVYSHRVRNRSHYQLTHLLENGHAKRGGGRVEPRVHIKPLAEQVEKEFEADIIAAVKQSG
jgi:hypothetical protein